MITQSSVVSASSEVKKGVLAFGGGFISMSLRPVGDRRLWRSAKVQSSRARAMQARCTRIFVVVFICSFLSLLFSEICRAKFPRILRNFKELIFSLRVRASRSLTGYPAKSGSGGNPWRERLTGLAWGNFSNVSPDTVSRILPVLLFSTPERQNDMHWRNDTGDVHDCHCPSLPARRRQLRRQSPSSHRANVTTTHGEYPLGGEERPFQLRLLDASTIQNDAVLRLVVLLWREGHFRNIGAGRSAGFTHLIAYWLGRCRRWNHYTVHVRRRRDGAPSR